MDHLPGRRRFGIGSYSQIAIHTKNGSRKPDKEFVSTAKKFPALIHTCGLAQAVAFALAKKDAEYIGYLAAVLKAAGHADVTDHQALDNQARTQPLSVYLRLSRDAINAASWLKRYVEAAGEEV
jgi:CRISPR-associated protein Cmr5